MCWTFEYKKGKENNEYFSEWLQSLDYGIKYIYFCAQTYVTEISVEHLIYYKTRLDNKCHFQSELIFYL